MTDATALAAAIAEGRTTARAAMTATLRAADARREYGAIARLEPERALQDADQADSVPPAERGPFHGVPFLSKDLGNYARGMMPSAGSPAIRALVPDNDADSALFARFRAGGLLPFGLTTVPEFGLALSSEPPGAPPARNPFETTRTPGGSSGGAAAAVAAGITAIAHATDAAGSIRVPAACCGLYGLKSSRGATPHGPDFLNHLMGLASELVVARSLRDVRTAFDLVNGTAPGAPTSSRIRLCRSDRHGSAENTAAQKAANALASMGIEITEATLPEELNEACRRVARTVLSAAMAEGLDALGIPNTEISPICAATAAEGRALSGATVFAAAREIEQLSYETALLFEEVDALLLPVLSGPPPKVGHFDPNQTDPGERFEQMENMAPFASIANVAGLPALAFPVGMQGGLPIGLQLIGPMGSDRSLLDLAAQAGTCFDMVPFPHPIAGLIQ